MEQEMSAEEESVRSETLVEPQPVQGTLFHPFKCRLNDKAAIETSSATCMSQVGFACWSIGMLTIFRPSFVLLISILPRVNVTTSCPNFPSNALIVCYFWFVLVLFVFFVLGWIPMFATSIKKRWVLLIHPWALLLLYFDVVVWLTITVFLHLQLLTVTPFGENTIKQVKYPVVFLILIYVDVTVYFVIYYVYGTYYIVAELTIIEKFY